MPGFSWTLAYASFSFADSNLYPLNVINDNLEHNRSPEYFESFYGIIKPKGDLGELTHPWIPYYPLTVLSPTDAASANPSSL